MTTPTVVVKPLSVAREIAKVLRRDSPGAADRYLDLYPRRRSIEQAALENELGIERRPG